MEWYFALLLILGSFLVLMALGMPIAFCFVVVNVVGVLLFWGGEKGLVQLGFSILESVSTFVLLPLPLFILMGAIMLHSGLAPLMMDALDRWIGRLPGRLSLLAVGSGTLFSTLTGEPIAAVAMLGSTLVPEMEKRGLKLGY